MMLIRFMGGGSYGTTDENGNMITKGIFYSCSDNEKFPTMEEALEHVRKVNAEITIKNEESRLSHLAVDPYGEENW